eukprot:722733-Pleurochrysis_carterae.AAC.2
MAESCGTFDAESILIGCPSAQEPQHINFEKKGKGYWVEKVLSFTTEGARCHHAPAKQIDGWRKVLAHVLARWACAKGRMAVELLRMEQSAES